MPSRRLPGPLHRPKRSAVQCLWQRLTRSRPTDLPKIEPVIAPNRFGSVFRIYGNIVVDPERVIGIGQRIDSGELRMVRNLIQGGTVIEVFLVDSHGQVRPGPRNF